jgi:thioredoxin 1
MKKILYFTADWCGPCKLLKPKMQELANQVPISFINVDTNSETSQKYNVRSIPCVVLIDVNGNELGKLIGTNISVQSVTNLYNK